MAGIIYTAQERAPLVSDVSPAHVAGNSYSIDVKLQQYTADIETPKTVHTSLAGGIETVLHRTVKIYNAVFIWDNTQNNDMEEFMYSIAAGEVFTFDAYGTIAVPDEQISVVCVNSGFSVSRMSHGPTPWRGVAMTLRPAV